MTVKLLTEHHLEFLSLKGGYTGSSESTLVKMTHCWKSHDAATVILIGKLVCLFGCFVALRPKSTAMVMGDGRSVHVTTLFPGQA